MGDTPYDDLHADDTSVSENPLVGRLERELASLRAEKERAEAERDEAIRMRDRHAEASKAQNEDITALMAERDAALKDAERYRFIRAGKSGTYNTILIHAGSQLDAAIDAARKGEQ